MKRNASDSFLPYGHQVLDEADITAVVRVLSGEWLTGGPTIESFEKAFAAAVGAKHAVVCANGTAALHLTALALELGPGDTVIVPDITFLASASAYRLAGAHILFADVDPATGLMTAEILDGALRSAPASRRYVVVPVHLGGRCSNPEELAKVARQRNALIVEDACHALGTQYARRDGSTSQIGACCDSEFAVFSFHPVKTIAMGEGGAITTADESIARKLRRLRSHGMTRSPHEFQNRDLAFDANGHPNPWYYEMEELGLNYRITDIQCALGLSQLDKLPRFAARRRTLAARYDQLLAPLAPNIRPNAAVEGCDPVLHLYSVRIDFDAIGVGRGEIMRRLEERGIGTQVHYIPLHRQPYYKRTARHGQLPGADAYYASTLSLPLFPSMNDSDVDRVVEALRLVTAARQ